MQTIRYAAILSTFLTACASDGGGGAPRDGGAGVMDAAVDGGDDGGQVDAGNDAPRRCVLFCGALNECCVAGEECVGDSCLSLCAGSRCGADDALCCAVGQLCVGGGCVDPGVACRSDAECATGEVCEPLVGRCVPLPPDATCRYIPPIGRFEPELQWRWPADSVGVNLFNGPVIAQTNDDNGDGSIDGRDVPDLIQGGLQRNIPGAGREYIYRPLAAISGDDGRLLWEWGSELWTAFPFSAPAVGDLDADGTIEIVQLVRRTSMEVDPEAFLSAWNHDGSLLWVNETPIDARNLRRHPAIADVDDDGMGEILIDGRLYEHDGAYTRTYPELGIDTGSRGDFPYVPVIANIDADPELELIASNAAYEADGTIIWARPGNIYRGLVAIGNVLPSAGSGPQIVATDGTRFQVIDAVTGNSLLGPVDPAPGVGSFGTPTPPVIADFNGDGMSEFAVNKGGTYIVVDPRLPGPSYAVWTYTSMPVYASFGSTVFDFDGDRASEVVLMNSCNVLILKGSDGTVLWSTPNLVYNIVPTPRVADIDNDGNAELIVFGKEGGGGAFICGGAEPPWTEGNYNGVRVFRDRLDNWVPTRPAWNQFSYHIDNVDDDGRLPRPEAPSWTTHNTYGVNRLVDPEAAYLAPDLAVVALGADTVICPSRIRLRARVQNKGSRGVPAGLAVAFYVVTEDGADAGTRTPVGIARTTRFLLSGESAWVEAEVMEPALDAEHRYRFYAVADDDGTGRGSHSECDEGNNRIAPTSAECRGPI